MKKKKEKKKKKLILSAAGVLAVVFIIWTLWGNTALMLTEYTVSSEKLPAAFDGYKICHISDFHDSEFGKSNEKLVNMIKNTEPDIIVITGDLVDHRRTDVPLSVSFVEQITPIAPVYYVTGNHEEQIEGFDELIDGIMSAGAIYLNNRSMQIQKAGVHINISGVDDPYFLVNYIDETEQISLDKVLEEVLPEEGFNILLSHRPDYFDIYVTHEIDLVLSGHAHGGQVRLPYFGGVIAPDQGFLPKYSEGQFTAGDTNMIISRGLGNSIVPLRVNNRPEVVVITLTR